MMESEIDPELIEEVRKRTKWVTYKDKQIFYQDYTDLSGDEVARLIPAFTSIELETIKEKSLCLINFTGSFANKAALSALGESGKLTKHLYEKTAVLGITGIKKILMNAINRVTNLGAKSFETEEEAKEWLII